MCKDPNDSVASSATGSFNPGPDAPSRAAGRSLAQSAATGAGMREKARAAGQPASSWAVSLPKPRLHRTQQSTCIALF